MPIYEYDCPTCGTFEVSQKITEKPLRRCPTCKGKVTKLISSTSFQLKGSGWYVTDYAGKDNSGKKPKEEGKSETGASSKETPAVKEPSAAPDSSNKADSKAETKAA
jgi:putative FmdB family regulatory protein